jgi:hypothetical protein
MRQPGWNDRDGRDPASLPGVIILSDGVRLPVIISNVSKSGCRVECQDMLPIGARVRLEVGNRLLEAEVRWALEGSAGLRMTEG